MVERITHQELLARRQKQAVVFCLLRDDEVLLEKRGAQKGELFEQPLIEPLVTGDCGYVLPGGKVETGEKPVEAFLREFQEEVGVNAKSWECIRVFGSESVQLPKEMDGLFTIHLYLATECDGAIDEQGLAGRDLFWVPLPEVLELKSENAMAVNSGRLMLGIVLASQLTPNGC